MIVSELNAFTAKFLVGTYEELLVYGVKDGSPAYSQAFKMMYLCHLFKCDNQKIEHVKITRPEIVDVSMWCGRSEFSINPCEPIIKVCDPTELDPVTVATRGLVNFLGGTMKSVAHCIVGAASLAIAPISTPVVSMMAAYEAPKGQGGKAAARCAKNIAKSIAVDISSPLWAGVATVCLGATYGTPAMLRYCSENGAYLEPLSQYDSLSGPCILPSQFYARKSSVMEMTSDGSP